MKFDSLYQPYPSNRYCLCAKNGVVATGSNLASAAGLEILKKGGNAVDAAVATAACLTVVEPTANGLGSDAFAIVWMKDHLYGLNGSGYSPKNITLEKVQEKHSSMPKHGWIPVMVPGCVASWQALIDRFGNLTLKEVLQPAIQYARNGYPVSPLLAKKLQQATEAYTKEFGDKKQYAEWFQTFTKNGKPYEFGEIIKLENHAKTLELIAKNGAKGFYEGEVADQFVKQSDRDGGYFTHEDLSSYQVSWVDPISVNYKGYDVFEIPPNGQGIVALMALNMLKHKNFIDKEDEELYHYQIEAIKRGFQDAKHYVSDPSVMKVDSEYLLSEKRGIDGFESIDSNASILKDPAYDGGTVYLATADKDGNMVSMIQSNYMDFGSGIVLEGYGVALQNRGADFSLDPKDINVLGSHKKSYHTIIPGFLMKDDKPIGPFGVMGAYMQPQGHVQVLMNMIDFNLNPQMALDAPRFQWIKDDLVEVEPNFPEDIIEQLRKRGHQIKVADNREHFGRGQIILRLDNGVYVVGVESRTDSNAAVY